MAKNGRPRNTPEAFWRKIEKKGPNDCWLWLASVRNGYGNHSERYSTIYAHRYAYLLTGGKISPGLQVMHSCNNKLCCNPKHLSVGTPSQNTNDAYRVGLIASGERHHKAKFSKELIDKIRADSRPQLLLQKLYGISQAHISNIKLGRTRKHEVSHG